MRRIIRTKQVAPSRLELAKSAFGRRDYALARALLGEVLDDDPSDRQARMLLDKIELAAAVEENDTFSRDADLSYFEWAANEPARTAGLILFAAVCIIAAVVLAYEPVRFGLEHGFQVEVRANLGWGYGRSPYPVHLLLAPPVCLACVGLYILVAIIRAMRR